MLSPGEESALGNLSVQPMEDTVRSKAVGGQYTSEREESGVYLYLWVTNLPNCKHPRVRQTHVDSEEAFTRFLEAKAWSLEQWARINAPHMYLAPLEGSV